MKATVMPGPHASHSPTNHRNFAPWILGVTSGIGFLHQHATNEFTLAEAFCSLPPSSTTPSLQPCPPRSMCHPKRSREGPRTTDLGHLARGSHLELPGKGLKNNTKREKNKNKRNMNVIALTGHPGIEMSLVSY